MKVVISIVIIFLQFHSIFSQDLKIATFNCEFLNRKSVHIKYGMPFRVADSDDPQKIAFWSDATNRENKFKEATIEVAKHIKLINADVIGLTEVGKKEDVELLVNSLADLGLTYQFWEVCKSTDTSTGQHVAFLSKLKLKNVEPSITNRGLYFTESDKDETSQTGISKGMKASVKFENNEIIMFLLHFKSERGGDESDQQRIKQAEIVRNLTIPLIQEGSNVIIMGDFNSEKRHETLLTLRGFNDLNSELIQTGDDNYFKDFSTRWTYEYRGSKEQIDHILISIPLSKLCFGNSTTTNKFGIESSIIKTNNSLISDHNAFIVNLKFK